MTERTITTNPGRRTFLGACVALSATALTGSAAIALQADPVFAAIDAHRAAVIATRAALDFHSDMDELLPIDKCHSSVTAWEEKIVATDDPRWIAAERGLHCAHEAETDAALALVNIMPTTLAGVLALLRYTVAADPDGQSWPELLPGEGAKLSRPWHHFLVANLSEVLPALVHRHDRANPQVCDEARKGLVNRAPGRRSYGWIPGHPFPHRVYPSVRDAAGWGLSGLADVLAGNRNVERHR